MFPTNELASEDYILSLKHLLKMFYGVWIKFFYHIRRYISNSCGHSYHWVQNIQIIGNIFVARVCSLNYRGHSIIPFDFFTVIRSPLKCWKSVFLGLFYEGAIKIEIPTCDDIKSRIFATQVFGEKNHFNRKMRLIKD